MNGNGARGPRLDAHWDGEVWRTGPGHGRRELTLDGRSVPGSGWSNATSAQKGAWCLRISTKCKRDGYFKSRPSSDCPKCGDSPCRVGQDPYECDQEQGWDWYNGYSCK
jgi:hypothetical protein